MIHVMRFVDESGGNLDQVVFVLTRLHGRLTCRTAFVLVQDKHLARTARLVFALNAVADRNRVEACAILTVHLPLFVFL